MVLHGEAVQKLSRGRWKGPGDGPSPGWIVTTCSAEGSLEVRFMPFGHALIEGWAEVTRVFCEFTFLKS